MVKSDKFDLKGKQNINFSWSHGVALLFHWHQMPCCSGIGQIDSQREIKDDICLLHIKQLLQWWFSRLQGSVSHSRLQQALTWVEQNGITCNQKLVSPFYFVVLFFCLLIFFTLDCFFINLRPVSCSAASFPWEQDLVCKEVNLSLAYKLSCQFRRTKVVSSDRARDNTASKKKKTNHQILNLPVSGSWFNEVDPRQRGRATAARSRGEQGGVEHVAQNLLN